jgi:benzodiazapine receptor
MQIKDYITLALFILLAQSAGVLGSASTITSIDTWYVTLTKPVLNPPSWVFGPVWTLLYTLMGIASFLVWRKAGKTLEGKVALVIFFVHLGINALWSIIFFGYQNPELAFGWIVFLLAVIVIMTGLFWRISRWAGMLLLPYIAWVSFASYLNYSIWMLN